MYCKHCGEEISDDSNFCNYCGKEVTKEIVCCKVSVKDIQETIDSIRKLDLAEDIIFAKKIYQDNVLVKFRAVFKTNTFDIRYDYKNFYCYENEKEMKAGVIGYLNHMLIGTKEWQTDDFSLDIYVSIDVFISSDETPLGWFDEIYFDGDGNAWISRKCYKWRVGFTNEPVTSFWDIELGREPSDYELPLEEDPIILKFHKMK